jgi:DNA repair protein SbcC/Rad50
VRPTKLTIHGLTAYKQPVEIDFENLDLFAITGPTGAGKSSLVDAITFALFGKAPRVGREIKELISQGEDRLRVSLEFAANGDRWRIHRSTARRGAAPIQLERFDSANGEWQPEADRVQEVNQAVEDALHMDYEAFVRSVLLPQGQFQEFLSGDRDQRRKVLDGLLQLNVYAQMLQRANAIDREKTAEADSHRRRLDTELADATPEALKAAKARLKELKERESELKSLIEATSVAARTAEALSETQKRERIAKEKLATADKALAAANELLTKAKIVLSGMDALIAKVAGEITATAYDGDAHLRLTKCLPLLRQIEDGAKKEAKLSAEIDSIARKLEKTRAEVTGAQSAHNAAKQAEQSAADAYEAARHTNATALLRQGLKKGDPCPVCGQAAPELPKVQSLALDKLKLALDKAKADTTRASETVAAADKRLVGEERDHSAAGKQLVELRTHTAALLKELASAIDEPGLTASAVEKRIAALEQAKEQREVLEARHAALKAERDAEEKRIEGARTDVVRLDTEVKACSSEAAAAAKDAKRMTTALREAAKKMAWQDVAGTLDEGRDVAALLTQKLADAQTAERSTLTEIGAAGKQIEQIAERIELAKTLREQEKSCREAAILARDLASLLRADAFPAFLRERAMRTLAAGGSEWLQKVSSGRYDLRVDGQDFLVSDLWNAGEERSVKTLSGGETFLASLALALALAEHLPSLAGNGHRTALESLFIDEGFSNLDAETLDIVASALEVLGQDRRRLIGVVTHVPALAERMPARITVHKSQAGSTVSVE